ncbi:inositol monophosphatase 2-like isoform X1 [Myxocyprinus asiaticus]|uniref:inositol monophosphatase 2-like isoform X1 n=1 Tax=Myxocyprinus asiaticus TaxID=70543 RepID=UPI0022215907|nr:inositol monophosphatase 2-like isoform X1 [Myxocyprinus asiaticus]
MEDWSECLDVAVQIARRAGQLHYTQVVQSAVKQEKRVSSKSTPTDLVTEADHQVEELIISTLRERYPSHRFIGEESSAAGEKCELTDSPTWIIDPIDGTCNFVHSFPMVAVSIGFAVRKELEIGVIFHCFDGTLYTARKGHGAFCNGVRLQVSKEKDVSKALILTEIGAKRDPATIDIFLGNMKKLLSTPTHGVRIIGSSTLALCHIASGAAEAYYQYGLHCWDIAAAAVIIREAGGCVIDTTGCPLDLMSRRVVAAGTREIADYIVKQLQPINYGRDDSDPNALA